MKRNWLFLLVLTSISLALLLHCGDEKEEDNPTGPGNTSGGVLTAKVSGSVNLTFSASVAKGSMDDNFVSITGYQKSGSKTYTLTITLFQPPSAVNGSHDIVDTVNALDDKKALAVMAVDENNQVLNAFTSYSGSITFTESSPKLKGTFQFTGREGAAGSPEVTVTQGQFNVDQTAP